MKFFIHTVSGRKDGDLFSPEGYLAPEELNSGKNKKQLADVF
jgi:hypothetical protein